MSLETVKHDYPASPIAFSKVTLTDSFWLPRLQTQKQQTLPFALEKTEPAVENLRRCGEFLRGNKDELPFPHRFVSSDLYKVMEGVAYLLALEPDPDLEARMDQLIDLIGQAQQDDGYLYVPHICGVSNPEEMGPKPYSWVVHSHELYNVGHMYEGAVAYFEATGKHAWLDIAEKSAQHVNRVFFEGDPDYNNGEPINQAPGHQEPEIALCRLYRATGNTLYLDMAQKFLEIRGVTYRPDGRGVMSPTYAQQHAPVGEQDEAVGHAVRAAYMYAGMADVTALTGDAAFTDALDRIWQDIVNTRMHITGGLGAIHGIEGFGPQYELPNREAYNETCAAIANVFFNHRMFLLHRDAKFFDVAEVALYNNSLAGINLEGDRFFYVNPLDADGRDLFNHGAAGRSPWFDCACCPSNITRMITHVGGYMYAVADREVYALLYAQNQVEVPVNGTSVRIEQTTQYPHDGQIAFDLSLDHTAAFAFKLRIPTWVGDQFVPGDLYRYADNADHPWTITVNGEVVQCDVINGFACLERDWSDGDRVELDLPMPVRYSTCDERVEANQDRVAVTRGPLVYCAEEVDNGGSVQRFYLPTLPQDATTRSVQVGKGEIGAVPQVQLQAEEIGGPSDAPTTLSMIPYFAWNNRGNGSMTVWLPQTDDAAAEQLAQNPFDPAVFGDVSASSSAEGDSPAAVTNGRRPSNSGDASVPRWSSASEADQTHWLQLDFPGPRSIERVGMYWAQDTSQQIAPPKHWGMEALCDGKWIAFEKYITDVYGTSTDRYNTVHPAAELTCDGLRLNLTARSGQRVGILDIDLVFAKP